MRPFLRLIFSPLVAHAPRSSRAGRGRVACALVAVAVVLASVISAWACNVPVFRYALERWQAEAYEAVIFHRGPLTTADRAAIKALEKTREELHANLNITLADVDFPLGRLPAKLWQSRTNAALPHLVLAYQGGATEGLVSWTGPLREDLARQLGDSPARRALAKELLAGRSAVWLLVESGNRAADDAAAALIEKELRVQEKELELPPAARDDPKMRANIPLRILFSLQRMSRADPAEALFLAQLFAGESITNQPPVPVAFPVFGRGRALAALAGSDLSADVVESAGRFLVGACSCEVKELNPGKDLLLAANWESIFEEPLTAEAGDATGARAGIGAGATANAPETNVVIGATAGVENSFVEKKSNTIARQVLRFLVMVGLIIGALTLWRRR